jgi:hypothetical protein
MSTADHEAHRTRDRVLSRSAGSASSRSATAAPRREIAASWRRVAATGLDPGAGAAIVPLVEADLERRREESGLRELIPKLTTSLASVIDAGQLVVVADPQGRVLWRLGGTGVRRLADHLGFVDGSAWTEANVGTNAIGTALVLGQAVQVRGAEHFVESHTRWGCAAAPLTDPWTGRVVGVLDVSGPSAGLHPAELALVELTSRLTSMELLERRRAELDRLRASAAPLLSRVDGDALAVDRYGRLAAFVGTRAPERVALPDEMAPGAVWLPAVGPATAEPLGDGWLLRLDTAVEPLATTLTLDLVGDPSVRVRGESGEWSRRLSARHAEILLALVDAGPHGRSAAQLATDLFDTDDPTVTVRAEMSRLRKVLGSVLLSSPYRLAPAVATVLRLPDDPRNLLPRSSAPVVQRRRRPANR